MTIEMTTEQLAAPIGATLSLVMLAVFMILQGRTGSALNLKLRWLWVALAPVVVGLFVGKHIDGISAGADGLSVSAGAQALPSTDDSDRISVSSILETQHGDWTDTREAIYDNTNDLMLAHEYRRSQEPGQVFDIFIYLVRHESNTTEPATFGFDEVDYVEFYFGDGWDNQVFTVKNTGGSLGIRTHAFGVFLAICRINFKDGRDPEVIYRYIDFEMAKKA